MRRDDSISEESRVFTLQQLAERSGVSSRTIRYYTTEGLLPRPLVRGRYAAYGRTHLDRLRLIESMKRSYLPLTAIRERLKGLTDEDAASIAAEGDGEVPFGSAPFAGGDRPLHSLPASAHTPEGGPLVRRAQLAGPIRSPMIHQPPSGEGWRRIPIAPGIEIHARAALPAEVERSLVEIVAGARDRLGSRSTLPRRSTRHAHPRHFHLVRHIDRGWGEIGFEYRWEAADGTGPDEAGELASLSSCHLYEVTTYANNDGTCEEGWFSPPDPPFAAWRFRDPTDGRTAEVGMECFVATHGQAWDRHKIGGRLLPPAEPAEFTIRAVQTYRFFCEECGVDEVIPGPRGGPHEIVRTFRPSPAGPYWRYEIEKHGFTAWMDVDEAGFVADSLGLDFGPW